MCIWMLIHKMLGKFSNFYVTCQCELNITVMLAKLNFPKQKVSAY